MDIPNTFLTFTIVNKQHYKMKDVDIHNNFPDKELRDFFAEQIGSYPSRVEADLTGLTGIDATIALGEAEVVNAQNALKMLKRHKVIGELMADKGWGEFDVSDCIEKTLPYWKCFIGTQEEFDELMEESFEKSLEQ